MQLTDIEIEKIKRLIEVRKTLKLKQEEIARVLGINRSNLSAIENLRENRQLPFGTSYILEKEFDVHPYWFETGQGPMFNNSQSHDKMVSEPIQRYDVSDGIPMYNSPGAASEVEIYTDPDSTKIVGHLNFPGITKGSFALQVYGNSMSPALESGVWAVLRPIENKNSINWGQIYYIEYDDYRVFKRLLAGESNDEVTLWSDNQQDMVNGRPKHAPVTIKKSEIRALSLVTDIYKKSNH